MAVSFNFTGEYAIDQGADWYATFIYKQPAEITNISGNGTTVTVTAQNGFTPGQTVSIDGVIPPIYNLQNVSIATATASSFTITNGARTGPAKRPSGRVPRTTYMPRPRIERAAEMLSGSSGFESDGGAASAGTTSGSIGVS